MTDPIDHDIWAYLNDEERREQEFLAELEEECRETLPKSFWEMFYDKPRTVRDASEMIKAALEVLETKESFLDMRALPAARACRKWCEFSLSE